MAGTRARLALVACAASCAISQGSAARPARAAAEATAAEAAALLRDRPYRLQIPPGLDPLRPAPLVLVLHGFGSSGAGIDGYFGLGKAAAARGLLLATPEGTRDPRGRRFWNATDACCDLAATRVDDVAYLSAVLADVAAHHPVDPRRVYAVGHSNGGFMAHRLACDRADLLAAVVALAGDVWKAPRRCQPSEPVAVLQVHGDRDAVIPYEGGALTSPRGDEGPTLPSAPESVATWAAKNGCGGALADTGRRLALVRGSAGAETRVERHACTRGAAELWTIRGGAHVPALAQPAWAEAILDWLLAHPKG